MMPDATRMTGSTPVLPIVRVAVFSEGRIADMALPTEVPLREILPAVGRLLPTADSTQETASGSGAEPVSLAPIGGAPFSLDATLDTVGVVDGELLVVQPIPAGPPAPGIVEDIADATAIFSAARLRPWGIRHVGIIAQAAIVVLILAATGLAAVHRVTTGDATSLYALSALAATAIVAVLLLHAVSGHSTRALSIVALVPIAAAFGLATPGSTGPASVMLASAGVAAWSLVCMILVARCLALFMATTVGGGVIMVAAAVELLWDLPLATLGCGLIVGALFITVQAAQLSALSARLPLPVIPAPGDPTPGAPTLRVLEDLPRRVRISEAHQTGLIAGAVLLSVLGSLVIAGRPESVGPWAWYVVIATSLAAVLRARVWDSAACKAWLLAQPFLVSVGLLALFAVQGRYLAALGALAVFAALTGAFVVVAANPNLAEQQSYPLPMRRAVGFLAVAVDASLIPVMAYLVGLFALVLDR